MTMDFEMADKTDAGNSSRTGTSYLSTTFGTVNDGEKPKYQDSYISPNGMITSEGIIGGEKVKVRRKRSIELADVADMEMPKCSTPEGEDTQVFVRSEGRSPRGRSGSRSHSRANSWSRSVDLEANMRTATPVGQAASAAGAGGIVSKVMAMFARTTETTTTTAGRGRRHR